MIDDTFLYDTYAIIEIINGNPSYKLYSEKVAVINDFVFAELCYKLLREKVKEADNFINEWAGAIVHADAKIIREAMQFRVNNKERRLTMTDCISYFMAKKLGIKFLTGDKEFENLENVEFVK
ncbi:MAG: PIN domain-containing protein [Nanoarchaeota archaeon]